MSSEKAPGPDGYNVRFFKSAWNVVGNDVIKAVLEFFHNGRMLKEFNNTTIALVPKCDILSHLRDFRPISCCNTIYKIISKILANRL